MKIETIELRKVTADEGMVLTDGATFSDVSGSIVLGCNDSTDNWHEITEAEYEKILEAERAKMPEEV